MAKVLLTTTTAENPADGNWARGAFTRLRESAEQDRFVQHSLTESPEEADVILFAQLAQDGFYNLGLLRTPLYRRWPEKCFLFYPDDMPIPFLPGVYASIEKRWYDPRRVRTGMYLTVLENSHIRHHPLPEGEAPRYLYSFMGSFNTAPVRCALAGIAGGRGYVLDTSQESLRTWTKGTPEERDAFWRRYADLLAETAFALCPRGIGTGSIRLFEAMKMGRAPVILSDEWVPPVGPRWEEFSLRVAEKDVASLPALLQGREGHAAAMGARARREWEEWFSEEVRFHRVVEWCLQIRAQRRLPERIAHLSCYAQFFRNYHARALGRRLLRRGGG